MDALYDFLPAPPSNTDENSQRLYPRIVSKGTVTFEQLTEKIANHSGLSKGTILAVMDEIEYWTAHLLSDGYRVQIGNIGTASVSLKANTEVPRCMTLRTYMPNPSSSVKYGSRLRRNSRNNAMGTCSVRLQGKKSNGIRRRIQKRKG